MREFLDADLEQMRAQLSVSLSIIGRQGGDHRPAIRRCIGLILQAYGYAGRTDQDRPSIVLPLLPPGSMHSALMPPPFR